MHWDISSADRSTSDRCTTPSAGQVHESKHVAATLEKVHLPNCEGRPSCRPKKLAGDKGYRATRRCAPSCDAGAPCR